MDLEIDQNIQRTDDHNNKCICHDHGLHYQFEIIIHFL